MKGRESREDIDWGEYPLLFVFIEFGIKFALFGLVLMTFALFVPQIFDPSAIITLIGFVFFAYGYITSKVVRFQHGHPPFEPEVEGLRRNISRTR